MGAIAKGVDGLDWMRAKILRHSLRQPLLRKLFATRANRLAAWFALAFLLHLALALFAPLFSLLLGPLVLGVPHLVASIRYVPSGHRLKQKWFNILGVGCLVSLAGLRLAFDNDAVDLSAAALLLLLFKGNKLTQSLFVLLGILTYKLPLETAGALILGHNFVGFVYWMIRAPSGNERRVAQVTTTILFLFTGLIFSGAFDTQISAHGPLRVWEIGSAIFPHGSALLWRRAIAAYALGQGLHYFVWLKALAELEIPHQHAVNFRVSLRNLKRDLGIYIPVMAGILTLLLIGYGNFISWPAARDLYLSCATFHTYYELAGLALLWPATR